MEDPVIAITEEVPNQREELLRQLVDVSSQVEILLLRRFYEDQTLLSELSAQLYVPILSVAHLVKRFRNAKSRVIPIIIPAIINLCICPFVRNASTSDPFYVILILNSLIILGMVVYVVLVF